MYLEKLLSFCDGFEWDKGNQDKNWLKHHVTTQEAEAIFYNFPRIVASDPNHSQLEPRYACLGRTNTDRRLFAVFTIRQKKIRIISIRDQSHSERRIYEQKIQAAASV